MWPLLLAAAGLLKSEFSDRPREERQRQLQATTTRYSPWTHMQGTAPTEADPLGSAMQGATAGFGIENAADTSSANKSLAEAQKEYLNSMTTNNRKMGMGSALSMTGQPPGPATGMNYGQNPGSFWGMPYKPYSGY